MEQTNQTSNSKKESISSNEFHSVSTIERVWVVGPEEIVFVRDFKGNLRTLTKDQFESQFAQVEKDLLAKRNSDRKVFESHKTTEGGLIVHGEFGVEFYESQEVAETVYTLS